MVISTASSDGLGFHALLDPGMRLHRKIGQWRSIAEIFRNRRVLVLSPNCSPADLYTRYTPEAQIRNRWEDILEELKRGNSAQTVAVFPNGSLQFTPPQ